jgi:molecular chaperone IbpA
MYNSLSITTSGSTLTNSTFGTTGISNAVYTTTVPSITYGGTDLSKSFIGWDSTIKEIEKLGERMVKNSGNFPPYNVVKVNEDTYLIEFAVAGFTKKDIKVSQEKNALILEGSIEEDDAKEYLHKGIATRSFTRVIALAEYVDVESAEFENGILTVELIRNLPKEERPRQINIK